MLLYSQIFRKLAHDISQKMKVGLEGGLKYVKMKQNVNGTYFP